MFMNIFSKYNIKAAIKRDVLKYTMGTKFLNKQINLTLTTIIWMKNKYHTFHPMANISLWK